MSYVTAKKTCSHKHLNVYYRLRYTLSKCSTGHYGRNVSVKTSEFLLRQNELKYLSSTVTREICTWNNSCRLLHQKPQNISTVIYFQDKNAPKVPSSRIYVVFLNCNTRNSVERDKVWKVCSSGFMLEEKYEFFYRKVVQYWRGKYSRAKISAEVWSLLTICFS